MTDAARQDVWACLCLKHAPGLGLRTVKRILERFPSASAAVDHARSWLELGLATSAQVQGFLAESWRKDAEAELAALEEHGLNVLAASDPRFPQRLREIPDPPVLLYYTGDPGLLANPSLAMVGSRDCSRYGIELAYRIAMDLADAGVTVISGLAYGIDREAHLGGLTGPGSSIAVMGTGLDLVYPAANRDLWSALAAKGLVVTEFGPGTKPIGANFPLRNRIISGLSLGVLVVEASTRSGSLITARLAMEQGREVFAVPGPVSLPSYRGCHEIINKGARLVHSAQDVLRELAPQIKAFLDGEGARTAPGGRPVAVRVPLLPEAKPAKTPRKRRGSMCPAPARQDAPPSAAGPAHAPASVATPCPAPAEPPAQGLERELSEHLAAMGATHIDALCRAFSADAARISSTLVLLELKGVVRRLPGGYYLSA